MPPRPLQHRRNEALFFGLLLTLVVAPLVARSEIGTTLIQAILGLNLFAALVRDSSRRAGRILIVLVAVLLLVRLVAGILDQPRLEGVMVTLLAGIALLAAGLAVRYALKGDKVDSEHVFAALSAYLLAGIFCGVMYWQIERFAPGSIVVGSGTVLQLPAAIYFSFMTLATVGFGDIVPKSEIARGLVTLEAVVGQLYVAVMIARLLTLYSGRRGGT